MKTECKSDDREQKDIFMKYTNFPALHRLTETTRTPYAVAVIVKYSVLGFTAGCSGSSRSYIPPLLGEPRC